MAYTAELKTNPNWVKKMEVYFNNTDNNKDGVLTIEEVLKTSTKLQDLCEATPGEMEKLDAALRASWEAIGLGHGAKLNKEQFVEGLSQLGRAELAKKSRGEETLHSNMSNAYFDVMDANNDGVVTLDEFKIAMIAKGMDPKICEPWFNRIDKNKNGVVERDELVDNGFEFWFD